MQIPDNVYSVYMLKLGCDIRHEDMSGITLESLCSPWSQDVDDASTIQDVDLYSGGGEILFHWNKVFQAGIKSDLVPVLRPPI